MVYRAGVLLDDEGKRSSESEDGEERFRGKVDMVDSVAGSVNRCVLSFLTGPGFRGLG